MTNDMTHLAPDELLRRLQSFGQDHVLAGWDKLSPAEQAAFADTLARPTSPSCVLAFAPAA